MQALLDAQKIATYQPRVFEIDKYLVMNSHVYEKNTVRPLPLQFLMLGTGASSCMSMKQVDTCNSIAYNAGFRNSHIYNTELVDSEDPTIIYKLFPSFTDPDVKLAKFRISDVTGLTLIASTFISASEFSGTARYIGQNKDYIFLEYQKNYSAGASYAGMNYFLRVNKTKLGYEVLDRAGWEGQFICENMNSIYMICNGPSNDFRIDRIDKTAWTTTTLVTTALSDVGSAWERQINENAVVQVSDTVFDVYFYLDASGLTRRPAVPFRLGIGRYRIDTMANTAVYTEQIIDVSKQLELSDLVKYRSATVSLSTLFRRHKLDIINVSGQNYLLVTLENQDSTTIGSDVNDVDQGYTYLFKIKDLDNLELVSSFKHGDCYQASLLLNNGQTVVLANKYSLKVISLDTTSMKFKQTMYKNLDVLVVGSDTNENIWIHSSAGEVYRFANTTPTEVYAEYEKTNYDYIGANIETYLAVSVKDFSGNFRATKLKITLKGNQVFKSNSKNYITVTTSSSAVTNIPVTIKGRGELDFIIEMAE